MKKIINLFSTPIFETVVKDVDDLNKNLVSAIHSLFDQNDSKRILSHMWKNNLQENVKSQLGYSSFNQHDLLQRSEFNDVFVLLRPLISDFFQRLNFQDDWKWENAWCNVYPHRAYVPLHDHRGVHWSGVYYVQAERGCGDLLVVDPKEYALASEPENTLYRGNMISNFVPESGKLIVFPGYLKHESEPNQSDNDRIIISFNINCEKLK